jgi:hypothetical protein
VRNKLCPGDIVVFFSFRKFVDSGDSQYSLCAIATVERKVSQIDLWQNQNLKRFTKYSNLLIKPSERSGSAWEHFEPDLEGSRVHQDWLWRIADHTGFRKKDFKNLEETGLLDPGATIRGRSVMVTPNYVLFSSNPAKTHVLSKPPVVAWHSKGNSAEEWNRDKFSQDVRRITLEVARRASGRERSLRIRNSQRAHRHVVFELPRPQAEAWRAEFLDLIKKRHPPVKA